MVPVKARENMDLSRPAGNSHQYKYFSRSYTTPVMFYRVINNHINIYFSWIYVITENPTLTFFLPTQQEDLKTTNLGRFLMSPRNGKSEF